MSSPWPDPLACTLLTLRVNGLCPLSPERPLSFPPTMLTITLCLFLAGIAMGAAFACVWAWGVRSGQFRAMEDVKGQVFWPDIAPESKDHPPSVGKEA